VLFLSFGLSILESPQIELDADEYGLVLPFLEGILHSSSLPIVDGDEVMGYYAQSADQYESSAQDIRDLVHLVIPRLQPEYAQRVEVGQSIFLDYLFALGYYGQISPTCMLPRVGWFEQIGQVDYLEHHVYYALSSADRYGWVFSEDLHLLDENPTPDGHAALNAIASARELIRNGLQYPFELPDLAPYWPPTIRCP
jgi:hypothetical protein